MLVAEDSSPLRCTIKFFYSIQFYSNQKWQNTKENILYLCTCCNCWQKERKLFVSFAEKICNILDSCFLNVWLIATLNVEVAFWSYTDDDTVVNYVLAPPSSSVQAARATSGAPTAPTAVNARMVPSVTPSRAPASAPTATRGGAVRSLATPASTARTACWSVSASMAPPASTRRASASALQDTPEPCEWTRLLRSVWWMSQLCWSVFS